MNNSLHREAPFAQNGESAKVTTGGARAESDLVALVEALRVHPNGLSFQELRVILDRDTLTWHRLVKRALQKRRVYRTGASSSTRYHAAI
jgi:hypothetical protein